MANNCYNTIEIFGNTAVVAQVHVLRVQPGHFLLVVGQSRVVHVLPGPLHRHRVKAAARLVPRVYPANMYIVNVIHKAIQFVWVVPLLRIVP